LPEDEIAAAGRKVHLRKIGTGQGSAREIGGSLKACLDKAGGIENRKEEIGGCQRIRRIASKVAPLKFAPVRSAPVKNGAINMAPVKLAFRRF
jgi:hypothetical protein